MHLEELFRHIAEKRSEFIAKRAATTSFTGSATGVFPPRENKGENPPNNQIEAALTKVGATT
ncbi:MAG TPA: hypothetical protein ENI81_07370 [Phycisphaerales bacterium]|nr:hypothetical protein [Phycisphaerales bacterium]